MIPYDVWDVGIPGVHSAHVIGIGLPKMWQCRYQSKCRNDITVCDDLGLHWTGEAMWISLSPKCALLQPLGCCTGLDRTGEFQV